MKCGISVDMDFFCREKWEWDWAHSENGALFNSNTIWDIRGLNLDIKTETDAVKYADTLPIFFKRRMERKGFDFEGARLYVSWTHKDAYDFFKMLDAKTIFNFDAHYDKWPYKEQVDCGNWAKYLERNYKKDVVWITPKWLIDGLKEEHTAFQDLQMKRLAKVEGIFVAQSPSWVPPHFDKMMLELICTFGIDKIENGKIMKRKEPNWEALKVERERIHKEMSKLMEEQNGKQIKR